MRITTESGTIYETDGRTVTRMRSTDGAELRRDGEPVTILQYTAPSIGEQWSLLLMVREDGIATLRSTSPVVSIHA